MQNFFSTVIAAALLSGCQGLRPGSDAGAVTGPAASAIAGDMVSRLAEQIGPATAMTTIRMDKDTSEFAIALEAALKGWGYTVVTDKKLVRGIKPVELAYAAESLDGQILARTLDAFHCARASLQADWGRRHAR